MSIPELEKVAKNFRTLQAEIKAITEQADALKAQMIEEMERRNVEDLQAGEYSLKWRLVSSNRLNTTKLKADSPEVYAAFTEESISTRFTIS